MYAEVVLEGVDQNGLREVECHLITDVGVLVKSVLFHVSLRCPELRI